MIYLDNSEATLMTADVIDAVNQWANHGSVYSKHSNSMSAQKMIQSFKQRLSLECGFELKGPDSFNIYFTGNSADSNEMIITSTVRSFAMKTGRMPHIITSSNEHKSIIDCCNRLQKEKLCQLTILRDATPKAINATIRPNTCLISIAAAYKNGMVNNIRELAKNKKIPFHSDASYIFGKSSFNPNDLYIDAFSVSFDLLNGPQLGALIIRKKFVDGYDLYLNSIENIQLIGGANVAYKNAMEGRAEKNMHLQKCRTLIKNTFDKKFICKRIGDATPSPTPDKCELFWITPNIEYTLPHILTFTIHNPKKVIDNEKIRDQLEKKNIILGTPPHGCDKNTFYISLCDSIEIDEIKKFLCEFLKVIM